jgi:hypothetical protein
VDQHRSRSAATTHTDSNFNRHGHADLWTDRSEPGRGPNHPGHREPGCANSNAAAADSDSYRHANEDADANLDAYSEAAQEDFDNASVNRIGRSQDQPAATEVA